MEKIPFVYRCSQLWIRLGLRIWNRFRIVGGGNMPDTGGVIVASNHASNLDPPIVGCGLKNRHVRFWGRDSLFQGRIGKWWATSIGVVSIDRSRGDIAAFRSALAFLKAGGAFGLFPEGTRTLDGELQTPKAGIGFLIVKSGVPVLPVYIDGSFAALAKGAKCIKPVKITVYYGRLITPAEFQQLGSGRETYQKAAELVMARIAALKPGSQNKA